jgi:hypothetical protein
MTVDFPYARTILAVEATRTIKRTGEQSLQTRYFLSSLEPEERTPARWLALVRGHWGGVENRNHWRRDALGGEDRTRTRAPNILINLALIRSACLRVTNLHAPERSLVELQETCAIDPAFSSALLHHP